jgi:gamma-glutamyltranspeptidase/glutathione hydrolase
LAKNADSRDAKSWNGMVAAAKPEAAQVGIDILKNGGNAIDAAVAVGFALGVLEPNASGIGGGGFMLIRLAKTGEYKFIDYRETAPEKSTPDMYLNKKGEVITKDAMHGGKSVAVPGTVAGLMAALDKYGTMSKEEVLMPAIKYAEDGIIVSKGLADLIEKNYDVIASNEASSVIYLKDELPPFEGDVIVNKDLAETMRLIAKNGEDAFYKGEIANKIATAVQETGGIMTEKDLNSYEVKVRTPVKGTYRGYEIISASPSSSGGTHVIELLNIMENFELKKTGFGTSESWHLWAEAMKLSYADRSKFMGDMDYVDVPLSGLLSKEYAKQRANLIKDDKSVEMAIFGDPMNYESGSTTHFSVVDKEGNLVAVTQTIDHFFGSGVTVPGTGILLNDEMDDFTKTPGNLNSIEPGKRPLSSMSPTIILKDGKPFATLGTPGGKRIIGTVALIISNLIDYGMDIQEAIEASRINNYENGELNIEGRIPTEVQLGLKNKGHKLNIRGDYDLYFGGAQGIIINQKNGELHGGADPRRDGQAIGY